MLGDALSYPRNSSDWIPTILIGGILSALSVLVLPIFVVQGYSVRVMRSAAKGEEAAPSFTDWGGLVVEGLKLFAVSIVYGLIVMIPTSVVLFATVGISSVVTDPTSPPNAALGIVGILLVLLVTLLSLLVAYFGPAGYANFAIEGSLGAAFDFSTIVSGATTGEYFKAWLLAIVVAIVLGTIGGLLSLVLVGIFVVFYVQVVTYYLFGRGFAEGLGKKRRGAVDSDY
jgi:hypothetical protein